SEAQATLNIPVGADVFGSVAYQPHHIIGQDLTRMAPHISAVSPMLYPSHFYGDRLRLSNPYRTILEGSTLARHKLAGTNVRLIPYIQGFAMNLGYANMSLAKYIQEQIRACEDAGTDGFFIWHAGNDYQTSFAVLKNYGALYQRPPKTEEEIYTILGISPNALLY
ncbi:MAG: putative glycoside hydrolase, partial [Candidatus Margulisbacteria bacterium]|nr:putative glycoside hydrolase [Candidatus Margulisiibacteriota bacterium]